MQNRLSRRMELLKVFSFIFWLRTVSCFPKVFKENQNNTMCCAFEKFFEKLNFQSPVTTDLFVNIEKFGHSFDLDCLNKVLSSNAYTISQNRNSTSKLQELRGFRENRNRNFVVIVLDSEKSLRSVFSGIRGWQFSAHGFFVLVLTSQPTDLELDSTLQRWHFAGNQQNNFCFHILSLQQTKVSRHKR